MSLGLQDFDKKKYILVRLKNTASNTKQGRGQYSSLIFCLMDSRKVSIKEKKYHEAFSLSIFWYLM
jgi:hypothetical protein